MADTLESKLAGTQKSRLSRIADEFRQWRETENRSYFDHYLANSFKILVGIPPMDYRVISHENAVVHSYIPSIDDHDVVSKGNLVTTGKGIFGRAFDSAQDLESRR